MVLFSQLSQAQNYYEEVQDSVPQGRKVFFGGNMQFNIFGNSRFIGASPLMGYRFTPQFSMGLGATYLYVEREFGFPGQQTFKVSSNQYGGRIFGRFRVDAATFIHTEFETLNVELGSGVGDETLREWVPGFFIGAGMLRPFFANAGLNVTVLYNVLHDNFKSPYGSPWVIRGGVIL